MKIALKNIAFALLLFLSPTAAFAQAPSEGYKLTVPLIGRDGAEIREISRQGTDGGGANLAQYIQTIYYTLIGIAGLLAMANIVYGGILYTLSAGNIAQQGDAKDRITQAVIGLALLFGSFLILRTVNPQLLDLQNPNFPDLNKPTQGLTPELKELNALIQKNVEEQKAAQTQRILEEQEAAQAQRELEQAIKDGNEFYIAQAELKVAEAKLAASRSLNLEAQKILTGQQQNIIFAAKGKDGYESVKMNFYNQGNQLLETEVRTKNTPKAEITKKLNEMFNRLVTNYGSYGGAYTDTNKQSKLNPIYTGLLDLTQYYINLKINDEDLKKAEAVVIAAQEKLNATAQGN